jgi:hypothetical protein
MEAGRSGAVSCGGGVWCAEAGSWLEVVREEMAWAAVLLYNLSMLVVSGYLDGSFCSSCFGFFWLISAFFWRLCSRKTAYNVRFETAPPSIGTLLDQNKRPSKGSSQAA